MEDKGNIINVTGKNTDIEINNDIAKKAEVPSLCENKWQIIVLVIVLLITILQMSELLKISAALKSINVNMS